MNKHNFKNGSEKLTLKEAIVDSWRGIKMLHGLSKSKLVIDCVLSSIWAVNPLVVLFLSSLVISELSDERNLTRIAIYVSLAVGFGFLMSLMVHVLQYIQIVKSHPSEYWERHGMMWDLKYTEMDFKFTEDSEVTALKADAHAKNNAGALGLMRLHGNFSNLFGQFIGLVGAAIILSGMFFIPQGDSFIMSHFALVLLIIASVLIPAIVNTVLIKRQHRLVQVLFAKLAKYNILRDYYEINYIQPMSGGLDIRIFNLAEPVLAAVKKTQMWFKGDWSKVECQTNGITSSVGAVFTALAFLLIGLRALEGMYDIGEVTRFVGGVTSFYAGMSGIIHSFASLRENAPYLGMTFDYMDLPQHKSFGLVKPPHGDIEIKFENVSFKYPGTDKFVLKNLNLAFKQGERLAIVGMNGSGKTTMIKLLCRFYEPTLGKITLNGIDISEYEDYFSIFAVVIQDFCLMGLPLGQSVATQVNYNPQIAQEVLEKTGFGERLSTLERGLETPLYKFYDKNGINISGGEAQKIVLARAIYKNAPFVILDEPTAALDPIAEFEIYSKFNELIGEKTAIFISHRLSSCKFCHRIAVFHEGELVQLGTHDDLLDNLGKYHEMWHAQAQYYEDA
ncbi:MAG: ABC transporter ATP-binding protein/permease [Defluviitaleaceae bacterium]|nr:ABC transporter ATP-binding protein/permease [Defluviitaleaceae bacterium]